MSLIDYLENKEKIWEIFLKVLKKEIKIENVKIKINDSRKTSLHIEEYKLYKNGEIIKKYVSDIFHIRKKIKKLLKF